MSAAGEARERAIRWLAVRERSAQELRRRLAEAGFDADVAAEAVASLIDERLQSDERFTEIFVRSRRARGQGPFRIRVELEQQHGIDGETVRRHLHGEEADWYEAAWEAARKKFRGPARDLRDRAKRTRFLTGRGFERDQIESALERLEQEEHENQ
ncbi:MAG: regulatory protein RecX [Pseudomonadota bacterium]